MQKKVMRGFSLIELMIVVTIIGILATIAIPTYKGYTKRARFSEIIAATEPYKIAIALALQQGVEMPDINNGTNDIPDPPTPTKNLAELIVKNGIISASATKLIDQITLILSPDADGSNWITSGTCLNAGFCTN